MSEAYLLEDCDLQAEWSEAHGVDARTAARYRQQGLPWLMFAGKIYIPRKPAKEWFERRIRHPNPQRKRG